MTELHESTGSYVLHALDAAELREFEAHLDTCDTCPDEIADFCGPPPSSPCSSLATPPATLRSHVLDAIRTTPQLSVGAHRPAAGTAATGTPVAATGSADPTRGPRRAVPGSEPPDEPELAEPAIAGSAELPVDELAERRQRRQTRILSGLVAAMLALAVGLGGRGLHPGAAASGPGRPDHARAAAVRRARRPHGHRADWRPADRSPSWPPSSSTGLCSSAPTCPTRGRTTATSCGPGPAIRRPRTGSPACPRQPDRRHRRRGQGVLQRQRRHGSDFLAVNLEPAGSTPVDADHRRAGRRDDLNRSPSSRIS